MGTLLSVFVEGISFGLILFLLATGLSLTMGLMRIVNMAHGALYMVGAYVGVAAAKYSHNFLVGVLAAAVCTGLIGLLMEAAFLRRLFKQELGQVLLTIGFVYMLTNVTQWIWGTFPQQSIVPQILSGSVPVGKIDIPVFRLFLIGFGLVMAVLLWVFQDKTRIGAMVRAGMDNREIAGALGTNLKLLFTGVFVLGTFVAGLCGLFGGFLTGVNLGLGWGALLLSLVVVVIGGTGSIEGALLGGLIIGLLNAFGLAYFPQAASFIMYGALVLVLLVKPSGLLGRPMQAGGASGGPEAPPALRGGERETATARFSDSRSWQARLIRFAPYLVALAVLVAVPPFTGDYFQTVLTKVLIYALFAMSLDLTMGYTGLGSFGHSAFLGIAGYSVGIMIVHGHITSFWLVLLAALAITGVLAAVIGYISLRVSGVYYILVTMALAQLLLVVATKWYSLTGGRDGLVGIGQAQLGISGFHWTILRFYYWVLLGLVISFYILHRIVQSSFGSALIGIRENEPRMRSLGFNTWGLKYVAVIIGGLFAGLAGVFFAYFYGNMVPADLALEMSALPMLMVAIGGPATLWGPCLGAVLIVFAQHYSSVYMPDRWPLLLGAIFVLCVMLLKGGLAGHLSGLWSRVVLQKWRAVDPPDTLREELRGEKAES